MTNKQEHVFSTAMVRQIKRRFYNGEMVIPSIRKHFLEVLRIYEKDLIPTPINRL